MGDRAAINASYGGRQSGLDGEAIMASFGGGQSGTPTPTPTPSSALQSINADGWSVIPTTPATFASSFYGGTYDPDVSPTLETVTRPGFAASDVSATPVTASPTRMMAIMNRVMQPAPNATSLDATGKTAFEDYLYTTDSISGVTNNSAVVSPKPVSAHISTHRRCVGNSVTVQWFAVHRDSQGQRLCPYGRVRATDGTNTTAWVAGTWMPKLTSSYDRPGCGVPGFTATIDITALNTGLFTLQYENYPWVGPASSAATTVAGDMVAFQTRTFLKNVTKSSTPTILYCKTTGNDATGDGTSGNPYATWGKAMNVLGTANRGGAIVRMMEDSLGAGATFDLGATAVASNGATDCEVITEKDPSATGAVIVLSASAGATLKCQYMRFRNLTMKKSSTQAMVRTGIALSEIVFENCILDAQNFGTANLVDLGNFITILGGSGLNWTATTGADSAGQRTMLMRGFQYVGVVNGTVTVGGLVAVANELTGVKFSRNEIGYSYDGTVIGFNRLDVVGTDTLVVGTFNDTPRTLSHIFIGQNEFISGGTADGSVLGLSRDPTRLASLYNLMHWNNTYANGGKVGRANVYYDDNATNLGTFDPSVRTYVLMSEKGNIYGQRNTKGAQFVSTHGGGADSPNHVGNFPMLHGVGCVGNVILNLDADNKYTAGTPINEYSTLFMGLSGWRWTTGTVMAASSATTALFVNYTGNSFDGNVTYTAGTAGSDLRLKTDATAVNARTRMPVSLFPYTLGGQTRPTTGDFAGARGTAANG